MRRNILLSIGLIVVTSSPLVAGTFTRAPLAPDLGLDALTRSVTRERVGRDVFANPYATVTISNVDVYDRFPYVESRHFQVVSDPRWNRLVCGEAGRSMAAYDGASSALGPLSGPRGMAVDEQNRLYVADTGNDRIVVLQAVTEFDRISLVPLFAIPGLHGPYDVAYSDGGTPFVGGDDVLYVADTGRNRVAAFALEAGAAREVATVGELGSGPGAFAGPMAITVGRAGDVNTPDVYVADAHNRRIVHLRLERGGLQWVGDAKDGADVVTSLDTDQWGNLYAAAPQQDIVRKFNPSLEQVAELHAAWSRPRGFSIPFTTFRDHRDGSVRRMGEANAVSVAEWADAGGVELWNLGVAIDGLAVVGGDVSVAHFTVTDQAAVTLEISDAASGHVLSRRAVGTLPAGLHDVALTADDLRGASATSDISLRLTAVSSYAGGATDEARVSFRANGGSAMLPLQPVLLGNWPNPAGASTRISFVLPQARARATLGVFDASGRRVRSFAQGFSPGLNEIVWDGTDDRGAGVRSGLYFYRLDVGDQSFTRRMVMVR